MGDIDARDSNGQSGTRYEMSVAPDKSEAYMSIYPEMDMPVKVNPVDLKKRLEKNGVLYGVKLSVLSEIVKSLSLSGEAIENVVVASGKPAFDGNNARLELVVNTMTSSIGKRNTDGTIDYKLKESIITVKEGQIIAYYHDATEGISGKKVDGSSISAKQGKNLNISAVNVTFDKEKNLFKADIDGQLSVKDTALSVNSVRNIDTDVDMEVGCVDFPGTVIIKGSVVPDFFVRARGDIFIQGNVTDAEISCGGDLKIKEGIGGTNKSEVEVGGKVATNYIQNSTVNSSDSISVKKLVYSSKLFAEQNIYVEGVIMGSSIIAGKEIIAKDVGTETGVQTYMEVGVRRETKKKISEIDQIIETCKANLDKIKLSLGEAVCVMPREMVSIVYKDNAENLLKVLVMYDKIVEEIKTLNEQKNTLIEDSAQGKALFIKIKGSVQPGTKICIAGKKLIVEEVQKYVKFYVDQSQNRVVWASL